MFVKRFFYVCAGLLCLALAYHLGATNATGAPPQGNPVVAMFAEGTGWILATTANGDTYRAGPVPTRTLNNWELVGNVFSGPVPVQQSR